MNVPLKNLNIFTIPQNDNEFDKYFSRYGKPKYISVLKRQLKDYQSNTPIFFSKLTKIAEIDDYYLLKVNDK